MNILHIVNSLDCGGLENFTIELSKELKLTGDVPFICCLDKMGNLAPNAIDAGISVTDFQIKNGFDFKCLLKLRKYIIANKIDVVHTHNKKPLIYGTIAAKLAHVTRIIHTRHGQAADVVPWYIWKLNSKVVTISEDAKTCLISTNKIAEENVEVIENGIPLDKFDSISAEVSQELKNEIGLLANNQVIGIVARLAIEKDHKTLIQAFAEVLKVNESAVLLIVGDGPLNKDLQELTQELAIENSVYFLGFRQNIAELISIFDIFVLSSTSEGMSLTLLEAMASKKPIVATDVGGNPEVVQDKLTGFIVPPQNPIIMAKAITSLLQNSVLASEFALNGYERIKNKYSLVSMTEKYKKLYKL